MSDSMWRYASAAREDGIAILQMVDDDVGLPTARKQWESYSDDAILKIASAWAGPAAAPGVSSLAKGHAGRDPTHRISGPLQHDRVPRGRVP